MRTFFVALRTAIYAAGFVLLWVWLAGAAEGYDARLPVSPPAWLAPVGHALFGLGAVLVLSCLLAFVRRGRGTPAPFDPPRVFVASGPYRFVRNPMYLGAWMLVAGFGLARRSASIVLLSFAMLLAAHLFVLIVEEPGLEMRFGDSYRAYRASTRRWIPRFRGEKS